MYDIFISYSRQDRDRALDLKKLFEDENYYVWMDSDLSIGEKWEQELEAIMNAVDAVIVLWTEDSVSSAWVRKEAKRALDQDKLLPVATIELEKIPEEFLTVQTFELNERKLNDKKVKSGLILAVSQKLKQIKSSRIGPKKELEKDLTEVLQETSQVKLSKFKEKYPDLVLASLLEERFKSVPRRKFSIGTTLTILALVLGIPSLYLSWPEFSRDIQSKLPSQIEADIGEEQHKTEAKVKTGGNFEEKSAPSSPINYEKCIQRKLRDLGYYKGAVDGIFGKGTREALRNFEEDLAKVSISFGQQGKSYKSLCGSFPKLDSVSSDIISDLSIERTVKHIWQDTVNTGTTRAFYNFISADFGPSYEGIKFQVLKSSHYKIKKMDAKKLLGMTFELPASKKVVLLSKDGEKIPFSYQINIEVGEDGRSLFHTGENLHGLSGCLNHRQLNACAIQGTCSYSNKSSSTSCLLTEEDKISKICPQFSKYINVLYKHSSRAVWGPEYSSDGEKRWSCNLHYDIPALNAALKSK